MTMTDEHKSALAVGRVQGRAVRLYLEALAAAKPRRGRKRTVDQARKELAAVNEQLDGDPGPVERLSLVQKAMDLKDEIAAAGTDNSVDLTELEAEFIEAAGPYAERKGLTYTAFREVGVPPAVLKRAGVPRR